MDVTVVVVAAVVVVEVEEEELRVVFMICNESDQGLLIEFD